MPDLPALLAELENRWLTITQCSDGMWIVGPPIPSKEIPWATHKVLFWNSLTGSYWFGTVKGTAKGSAAEVAEKLERIYRDV